MEVRPEYPVGKLVRHRASGQLGVVVRWYRKSVTDPQSILYEISWKWGGKTSETAVVLEPAEQNLAKLIVSVVISPKQKGAGDMIEVAMDNQQKAALAIAPVDRKGNAAPVDGVPTWEKNDPDNILGDLTPSADGLSCEAPSADNAVGAGATVTVNADADVGEGVTTITEVFVFTVNHPMATSLGGTASVMDK